MCLCHLLRLTPACLSLFPQNYTQYIPLSIYDLQTWMGSPSIFVYDCSNAGIIVKSFKQFALQREQELEVGGVTSQNLTKRLPVTAAPEACDVVSKEGASHHWSS